MQQRLWLGIIVALCAGVTGACTKSKDAERPHLKEIAKALEAIEARGGQRNSVKVSVTGTPNVYVLFVRDKGTDKVRIEAASEALGGPKLTAQQVDKLESLGFDTYRATVEKADHWQDQLSSDHHDLADLALRTLAVYGVASDAKLEVRLTLK